MLKKRKKLKSLKKKRQKKYINKRQKNRKKIKIKEVITIIPKILLTCLLSPLMINYMLLEKISDLKECKKDNKKLFNLKMKNKLNNLLNNNYMAIVIYKEIL